MVSIFFQPAKLQVLELIIAVFDAFVVAIVKKCNSPENMLHVFVLKCLVELCCVHNISSRQAGNASGWQKCRFEEA